MNDLTNFAAHPTKRVALLVDGENLAAALADQIVQKARAYGQPNIRRVYGDAARLSKWATAPGFRMMHSDIGKNSADMLLTVEAMALALDRAADVLVVASSDRDFTHLALCLRERGFPVIGLGAAAASSPFRMACTSYLDLTQSPEVVVVKAPSPKQIVGKPGKLHGLVLDLIRTEGDKTGLQIGQLGGLMNAKHAVRISTHPEKTWRRFLLSHPELFICDPKGPTARVRLKV